MQKSLSSLKVEDENYFSKESQISFRCNECSGAFQKPILATISSQGSVQTYYACPRCLSKISDVKQHTHEGDEETSISVEKVRKVVLEKHEDDVECKHFLGYLKKRAKDTPFPDECLTCDKMIECLSH
jgi:DNA-directed RNA polymerase subunit RPC12/RpoP